MDTSSVRRPWPVVAAAVFAVAGVARAGEVEQLRRELDAIKREMQQMQETIRRQEDTIRRLERRTGSAPAAPAAAGSGAASGDAATALDRALEATQGTPPPASPAAPAPAPAIAARPPGAALRLVDVSVDTLVTAGTSTADDDALDALEGGAHDPRRRGFTLQQAELSLAGAVDPYFTGEAHAIFTDSSVELEEAFATTTALPYGLQVEAGHFLTEFGRLNPTHPHQWDWLDQPVVATRMFGGDGLRNPGVRVGWLAPLPWFAQLHLGAQNASGDTAVSFLGDGAGTHDHGEDDDAAVGIGGRPLEDRDVHDLGDLLYLARVENAFTLGGSVTALAGGSALFGPNATGRDTRTIISGGDLTVKWRPADNFRGWPFVTWQSEVMARDYQVPAWPASSGRRALPATTLHDWGLYSQLLWGFRYAWAAGLRYEYATGSGQSVGGRDADPSRDDRHRLSPLLVWRPTEFSRLRLQYDFDRADFLSGDTAHSVWLGLEVLYGSHPAHRY